GGCAAAVDVVLAAGAAGPARGRRGGTVGAHAAVVPRREAGDAGVGRGVAARAGGVGAVGIRQALDAGAAVLVAVAPVGAAAPVVVATVDAGLGGRAAELAVRAIAVAAAVDAGVA